MCLVMWRAQAPTISLEVHPIVTKSILPGLGEHMVGFLKDRVERARSAVQLFGTLHGRCLASFALYSSILAESLRPNRHYISELAVWPATSNVELHDGCFSVGNSGHSELLAEDVVSDAIVVMSCKVLSVGLWAHPMS